MTYLKQEQNTVKETKTRKVTALKEVLKTNELTWQQKDLMTDAQLKAFDNNDTEKLTKMINNKIKRLDKKLVSDLEDIKKDIEIEKSKKDIKEMVIDFYYKKNNMGWQTQCSGYIIFDNNDNYSYTDYTTNYTSGYGYDKQSTALGQFLSEVAKIILIKNYKKINDLKLYAFNGGNKNVCYQYGVGVSSYQTAFEKLGYKVERIYNNKGDLIQLRIKK